jgi:hypothetical protein
MYQFNVHKLQFLLLKVLNLYLILLTVILHVYLHMSDTGFEPGSSVSLPWDVLHTLPRRSLLSKAI